MNTVLVIKSSTSPKYRNIGKRSMGDLRIGGSRNVWKVGVLLGVCHCGWTSESQRAHVAKFCGRLRLRASKFSMLKIEWKCNFVGLFHHPFGISWFGNFWESHFYFLNYFILPRITDEGSVPEFRIWSTFLIKSDLKWWIHLRSLFLYLSTIRSGKGGGVVDLKW